MVFPPSRAADGRDSVSAAFGTWVFSKLHGGEENLLRLRFPFQQSEQL